MDRLLIAALAAAALAACTSPESSRTRGGGPGADRGNRGSVVDMHEGSRPYENTPTLIAVKPPSVAPANQADRLSRR